MDRIFKLLSKLLEPLFQYIEVKWAKFLKSLPSKEDLIDGLCWAFLGIIFLFMIFSIFHYIWRLMVEIYKCIFAKDREEFLVHLLCFHILFVPVATFWYLSIGVIG
jgi:hypothetical protein